MSDRTLSILGPADLSKSDLELGQWLVAAWLGFQAEKAGIPLSNIPPGWADSLIEASSKMDSDSVESAALESAFRKACRGDYEAAGRMLRSYVHSGAISMVSDRYAAKGLRQTAGGSKGGTKSREVRRGSNSKRAAILTARAKYSGSPQALVATIARKTGATQQYVRKVLQEENAKL